LNTKEIKFAINVWGSLR